MKQNRVDSMASSDKKQRLLIREKELERIVFGNDADVIQPVHEEFDRPDSPAGDEKTDDRNVYEDLTHEYWSKRRRDESDSDDDFTLSEEVIRQKKPADEPVETSAGVWHDSDDEITAGDCFQLEDRFPKKVTAETNLKSYLEDKFVALHKKPKWAAGNKKEALSDDSDDDDSLSKVAGNLLKKKTTLSGGTLSFTKCAALNADFSRPHGYNSVQFHPKYEIGIVSERRAVDFFKVEDRGRDSGNRLIKSYDFSGSSIERIRVLPNSNELIVGTHYPDPFTYAIDMVTGQTRTFSLMRSKEKIGLRGMCISPDGSLIACMSANGQIHVMDAKVKEFIRSMKMNDQVKCLSFSSDSSHLFSHGAGGHVYMWHVKQETLVNKFYDEGAVTGTGLAASPNGQFLSCGSESGVVNLYDVKSVELNPTPKPVKSFMNLTTEISSICFDHSSQLLLFCSRFKKNSIRMGHVASRSVYSNFPHGEESYGKVNEADFSPGSGFIALAANQRSVNLFRLCHFANY